MRSEFSSELGPEFSRGGDFAGPRLGSGAIGNGSPTPIPLGGRQRSSAVLTAPGTEDEVRVSRKPGSRFPAFGTYVYAVEGYEQATAFGRRQLPSEMTMTVHRSENADASAGSDAPSLESNEIILDLYFSDDHEEREIVAYRPAGMAFTYEASSVTFGPGVSQTSEATYEPPMLQIPARLQEGAVVKGTSTATAPDGTQSRVEDWTVEVEGRSELEVAGESTPAWVIAIERKTQSSSDDQVSRMRRYWFDPKRGIWVKWEETMRGSEEFGPGAFSYSTEFTATLERVEPV